MKNKCNRPIFKHYLLMEVLVALAIFVFVAGSFYSLNSSMGKYRRHLENQTQALCVIDNFLERLSSEKNPSANVAEKIFRLELDKSPLKDKEGINAESQKNEAFLLFEIKDRKGKILANAKIRTEKKP